MRSNRSRSLRRFVTEYVALAVVAIVLASLIRSFLGLAFYIPSESMVPTLKVHDRVVVSRLSYHLHDPRRGDVVVFQNPQYPDKAQPNILKRALRNAFELVGMHQPKDKNLIKRLIGLPGDRLMVKDGGVWINGKRLAEPWLQKDVATDWSGNEGMEITVPSGHYFMMGDNRGNSCDSRCFPADKRFVPRSSMVGRAFVRVWPISRWGGL